MNDNVMRLDMETKVALMAALIYANNEEMEVDDAIELAVEVEQLAHKRVCEIFRERKLSRAEE